MTEAATIGDIVPQGRGQCNKGPSEAAAKLRAQGISHEYEQPGYLEGLQAKIDNEKERRCQLKPGPELVEGAVNGPTSNGDDDDGEFDPDTIEISSESEEEEDEIVPLEAPKISKITPVNLASIFNCKALVASKKRNADTQDVGTKKPSKKSKTSTAKVDRLSTRQTRSTAAGPDEGNAAPVSATRDTIPTIGASTATATPTTTGGALLEIPTHLRLSLYSYRDSNCTRSCATLYKLLRTVGRQT